MGGEELREAAGEYGPPAAGAVWDLPAAGRGDYRYEGIRRRGPAQRGAVPGREGADCVSMSPLCADPSGGGLRHVRRSDDGESAGERGLWERSGERAELRRRPCRAAENQLAWALHVLRPLRALS